MYRNEIQNFDFKPTIEGKFACGDNCTPLRSVSNAVVMGTSCAMANKAFIADEF